MLATPVPVESLDGLHRVSAVPAPSDVAIDAQFIVMLEAFRPYGGIARLGELGSRFAGGALQREAAVLLFDWGGQTWVPLFQFEAASSTLHAGVGLVVAALRPTHDGWQIATWFARPCTQLDGAAPIERLVQTPQAVLAAARHAGRLRMN